MALITKPNTFSAGAVIVASEHNENFDTLYSEINGNLDKDNVKAASIVNVTETQTITGTKTFNDIKTKSPVVDVRAYGAVIDGITDDSTALQGALDTKKQVYMPKGTYYTGTTTVYSYPNQIVFGDGIDTTIIKSDASVGWAIADTDGVISLTTKALSSNAFLRDFTIQADAANATGLRFAGVSRGGLENIKVTRAADEGAGSRTGIGIAIIGLDKVSSWGCNYNSFINIQAVYFQYGIVLGRGTNQNTPFYNTTVWYCDSGIVDDDGTISSYTNKSYGIYHQFIGGAIEQINGDGMKFSKTGTMRTVVDGVYFGGIGGDAIENAGTGTVYARNLKMATITGEFINNSSTGRVIIDDLNAYPSLFGANERAWFLSATPYLSRMYDTTPTHTELGNPKIISGQTTINGDGSNEYARSTITFDGYGDLPTTMYVAGGWGIVIGTAAGTVANSLYNVAFSDFSTYAADTDFTIEIRKLDGTAIAANAAVTVQWFLIIYTG